jgi:hypothetical protein
MSNTYQKNDERSGSLNSECFAQKTANEIWFEHFVFLLNPQAEDEEDAIVAHFPLKASVNHFKRLKTMLLSTHSLTMQVTGEPPDILTFEMESLSEDNSA